MSAGQTNRLWWDFLARHHNDPEAVEARRQEHADIAAGIAAAVPCPDCFVPAGVACQLRQGFHFGRGAAYARTGGA